MTEKTPTSIETVRAANIPLMAEDSVGGMHDEQEFAEWVHADHVSPLLERIAELEYEAKWVRRKLGLPEDAGFVTGDNSVAGSMHVMCADAHGMTAYINAHKCDDKQGEIARLTVDLIKAREQIEELTAEVASWNEFAAKLGPELTKLNEVTLANKSKVDEIISKIRK